MRKLWLVVEITLVVLVLLVAAAAGGAWLFARSSLPAYGSALTVTGLKDEVRIYRDSYGVPHIFAKNTCDLFFAQGYVQAQDRLWEMDLSRRAVQGRLAEIFGPDYVDADYFLRTIGFYRAAQASLAEYPAEAAAAGTAYADGVNAFIQEAKAHGKLPLEFRILGYEPEPWTLTDSAAIGKYMAWVLGGNMESELFYAAATEKLGPAKASALFPTYPADGPIITVVPFEGFAAGKAASASLEGRAGESPVLASSTTGSGEALTRLLAVVDKARLGSGPAAALGLGSNNWVVAGQHTRSGKPLLANDMHLEIKQPSIWYQNHLVCPGSYNVTGVMFPGVPGVIVGHNDRIAWGVTNVGPDVQDLYIEKPNPDNPHQFEYDGVWEPAQVYREEIRVKGQAEPVIKEVVVTRHGPIITDVVAKNEDEAEAEGEADQGGAGEEPAAELPPLALRWTALEPTFELQAVLGFDRARNWDDFKAALGHFEAPAQNFVFADVDGNIAYRANGRIPVRSEEHVKAGSGLLPVPGWTSACEWQSFIPWDELPTLVNPPAGVIVTANHRVPAPDYPYFISAAWSSPYRAASIWQELCGRDGLGPEDMEAIQNDVKNLQAARLYPILKATLGRASASFSATEKEAWDILDAWAANNPRDLADSPAPTIFHTFYLEALKTTFADELGEELFRTYLGAGTPANTFDAMLLAGGSEWFDDTATADKVESMADTLVKAFKTTVAGLADRMGGRPSSWKWGKVHTVTFDHPMGSVTFLRPFFNVGPFPTSGSGVTACAKGFSSSKAFEGDFSVQSGAPWRFVADLSDLDHCFDVVAVGVSGQPFSPHYSDQKGLWLGGGYKPMLYDEAEIQAQPGVEVTILSPGR